MRPAPVSVPGRDDRLVPAGIQAGGGRTVITESRCAMRKSFRREAEALPEIFGFIDEFIELSPGDRGQRLTLQFAVEELFSTVVTRGPEGSQDVRLELERRPDRITATLVDTDVDPYDDAAAEPRTAGGLGLHLARRIMDGIEYDYSERTRRTVLTKMLR